MLLLLCPAVQDLLLLYAKSSVQKVRGCRVLNDSPAVKPSFIDLSVTHGVDV